ncbi:Glycosyltransferase involved in cell wall bisynthesis [Salipiger thiooxidans]|uniref:Glycosyltransferase involved in cell wall bisynthesis n=1 Tax=Salipiger thiooxidans TaxID=282683 RepID=A0A1G7LLX9_9RHOB|nr:glycosyltransferase [Salipiger thiooxidans]SDF50495.1 Glycosyltransferase involved in cell wall bisynthesis [Salipiger thiooxidans]
MKVVHFVGGYLASGAGRAAEIIHLGLQADGIDSTILTGDPKPATNAKGIVSLDNGGLARVTGMAYKAGEQLTKKIAARGKPVSLYSPGLFGHRIPRQVRDADIVHLHWLNTAAFVPPFVEKLSVPTVWTLHDMWPMTGGCHYALDCRRFETTCGACPRLSSSRERDLSTFLQARLKRRVGGKVHVAAISEWIALEARASAVLRECPITVIPNAVDTKAYFPVDRRLARTALGLDPDRPIVLTGHASNGWLKGSDLIVDAVDSLRTSAAAPDFDLIGFGTLDQEIGARYAHHYGRVYDDVTLRLLYSAADVFVAASRYEAFGRTLIEAMACGTPVASFRGTGPDDIIVPGQTGELAEAGNGSDLGAGIARLLGTGGALRDNCRNRAETVYARQTIAAQYQSLYRTALTGAGSPPSR